MEPFTVIEGEVYDAILANAKAACIGGSSAVREDRGDRQRALHEDQLVGQLGEYAICRWFGAPEYYFERRARINADPLVGDDGEDFFGQIDVKTSLMRGSGPRWGYRLLVRPRERHDGNRYVLALVDQVQAPATVWLMGWAHDSQFEWKEGDGPLKGAWAIWAFDLEPMSTIHAPVAA